MQNLDSQIHRFIIGALHVKHRMEKSIREHGEILEKIKANNGKEVEKAIGNHFYKALEDLRSLCFFITLAKSNFDFQRLYSQPVDKTTGFQSDQILPFRASMPRRINPKSYGGFVTATSRTTTVGVHNQQVNASGLDDCRVLSLPVTN